MFKNRWRRSLPLFLNPDLLICSTKVHFLVHFTLFISLCNFPNTLLNGWVEHHYITLLKKELVKMKKKFSNCYSKGRCITLFRMGLFGDPEKCSILILKKRAWEEFLHHILCMIFQEDGSSSCILLTDQISLPDCLYFLRYREICVLQLFLNQVVTS